MFSEHPETSSNS